MASPQASQPLTSEWVREWNVASQEIVRGLIERTAVPPPRAESPLPPTVEPESDVLYEASLDPADGDEVSELLGGVRRALEGLGEGTVRVALVRRR